LVRWFYYFRLLHSGNPGGVHWVGARHSIVVIKRIGGSSRHVVSVG
jgi:hypothetical protein